MCSFWNGERSTRKILWVDPTFKKNDALLRPNIGQTHVFWEILGIIFSRNEYNYSFFKKSLAKRISLQWYNFHLTFENNKFIIILKFECKIGSILRFYVLWWFINIATRFPVSFFVICVRVGNFFFFLRPLIQNNRQDYYLQHTLLFHKWLIGRLFQKYLN